MSLLSLFAFTVMAAETIISPIPDNPIVPPSPTPAVSFGQIMKNNQQVLGASTEMGPTPTPLLANGGATPTPTPTPTPIVHGKNNYTIAVLGDSMVDTLGPGVPHLAEYLKSRYPGVSFTIFNYGVGGTNIEYGITRITNDYEYLGNHIAALAATHADLVILESFAYNPLPVTGLDRHWLDLAKAVDTIHSSIPGARILIVSTIAPNATVFGDGAPGISFGPVDKQQHVDVIKSYLDSTLKFAQSQHIPAADVFHPSLGTDGNGKLAYINPGDHIHYSDSGRELFGTVVANAIVANNLLE